LQIESILVRNGRARPLLPLFKEVTMGGMVKDPDVARRIARAVVSDIALYNQPKVEAGIAGDNLFEVLQEEIEEGRTYYQSRIDPDVVRTTNYFNEALVDILVRPMGRISSRAW
jgi:spore germination protein GerM